jgi:protoporphyrinogen oxidase
MAKKRILILGAGLSGLSAAWHLKNRGIDCKVFEKEPEVGGLCRSKKVNGFTFDCSGHLLHFKRTHTFNLIKSLLDNNLSQHQRNSWIYSFDKYIRYPFQANLYGLPPRIVKECLIGFIRTLKKDRPGNTEKLSFLEWINRTFGRGIAKHFMIPYNEKFWTISPQELTCEWLDGFIPVPSLSEVLEGTIEESLRPFGYNSRFWYPERGGINQLPLALASRVKNIHTDCKVTGIDLFKKEVNLSSGDKEKFDFLISTIPLPEMPYIIKEIPREVSLSFKKLRWNSIFNLNLGIEKEDPDRRHWVYFPQEGLRFFRIGFFHNFSSSIAPANKSSLYVELSYSKDKPINKDNIILHIKEDLKKVGLLGNRDNICVQDINDIKYGYPIYDKNYRQAREEILRYLSENNIIPTGRYGSWRYFSMEGAFLDGKRSADFVLENA